MATLGVRILVLTNAAGGIRRTFSRGALMMIADHVNLTFRSPLIGPLLPGEERFPDMSEPYDAGLRARAREVARERGIALDEGVYLQLLGPTYETPAEVRMLERLGADAVGMSTVVEVIAARARGVRCLGFSTITNPAAGITGERLSHDEVQLKSRPSTSKAVLLMNESACRPGKFTAPGKGGRAARRTTTSIIRVAPLKEPVARMITMLLLSLVMVSLGVTLVPAAWPVTVESAFW